MTESKKKKKPFKLSFAKNILLILAILIVGFICVIFSLQAITRHGREFTLPDLTGMTVSEAQALTHRKHLRLIVNDSAYIRGMERGVIFKQNPDPGSKIKRDRRVLLSINSIIPKQIAVPYLVGYSLRQARTEIAACGLRLGRISYVEDIATNNVLEQKYNGDVIQPGAKLESESCIDLVLGLNPKDRNTYVPSVTGLKYRIAEDILHDNSLNIYRTEFDETVQSYSDSLNSFVYRQYPAASDSCTVSAGSSVTLYLSKDRSKIPVKTDVKEVGEEDAEQ